MFPLKPLFTFAALLLAITLLLATPHFRGSEPYWIARVLLGRLGTDSSICMDPAWAALRAGKPVYETVLFGGVAKFQYPISSLLLYGLAAVLHLSGALLVKLLILVSLPATLLLVGELFLAALPRSLTLGTPQRWGVRAAVALIGLLFFPFLYGAALGQIQLFQAFLWSLAIYLWMREQEELSGLAVALICVFKPQFAVFLLWALLRRRWRFLLPLLGGMLATQIVSVVAFGWHNELEYLAVISYLSRHGEVFWHNQSVNGLLQRLVGTGDSLRWEHAGFPPYNRLVYLGTTISSALLLALGLFLPVVRRWRDSTLDLVFFGLVATIASPIAWEHHYGYFLPAGLYVMARLLGQGQRLPLAFQASFLLLAVEIPGVARLAHTPATALLSYDLFAGLAVLAALATIARRSDANHWTVATPVREHPLAGAESPPAISSSAA